MTDIAIELPPDYEGIPLYHPSVLGDLDPAFVELAYGGSHWTIRAAWADASDPVPAAVRDRRAFRFPVDPHLELFWVQEILQDEVVLDLVGRVITGHSLVDNDETLLGVLTDDAQAALDELARVIEERGFKDEYQANVWDVEYWVRGLDLGDVQVDDKESLDAAVIHVFEAVALNDVTLYGNVEAAVKAAVKASKDARYRVHDMVGDHRCEVCGLKDYEHDELRDEVVDRALRLMANRLFGSHPAGSGEDAELRDLLVELGYRATQPEKAR